MKNGNLMANESWGDDDVVINVVDAFVLANSNADELMSSSVMRLQVPSFTTASQMANGFEPTLLNMLTNPC